MVLITRRSLVQIQPPLPSNIKGLGENLTPSLFALNFFLQLYFHPGLIKSAYIRWGCGLVRGGSRGEPFPSYNRLYWAAFCGLKRTNSGHKRRPAFQPYGGGPYPFLSLAGRPSSKGLLEEKSPRHGALTRA